jgi:acyl-coenzyme A thioesterase PaaI-like protein
MRPAIVGSGQHLTGQGLLQHRTKSMAFTEARVYDAQGKLCAMATGTFKYVPHRETRPTATD